MTISLLYILDWLLIAASLFNLITTLWLGLTVLLNAERRTWGTWAAGGGLLFGASFFLVHTAIVGQALWEVNTEISLLWQVAWLPFLVAPYLWLLVITWFTGTTGVSAGRLVLLSVTLVGGGLGLALPWLAARPYGGEPTLLGAPLVALLYPIYCVVCVGLAIRALRHPAPSERFMGGLARARTRPWLIGASVALLLVCIVAATAAVWIVTHIRTSLRPLSTARDVATLLSFDLAVSVLVAVLVVLIGQSIVSYEVFTGKALPRGGLRRYWRNGLILAAGYGLVVGGSLDLPVAAVYQVLLATLLVALFYALLSWRAFAEHERGVSRLRPFVSSQRLYSALLDPDAAPLGDEPFRALCADVLRARVGYLAAVGPLAALVGRPLSYPDGPPPDVAAMAEIAPEPTALCLPLEPTRYGGAVWAVPLWSERGLSGLLLLGEKRDGGFYTQEEIELARAAGERLIDARAGQEMARRMLTLQRRRLAESQVLDRRARRALHDEVLPQIHSAMLALAAGTAQPDETVALLTAAHREISNLLRELPPSAGHELSRLGLIGALRHVAEGELAGEFDRVTWCIAPEAERAAASLDPLDAEVLFFAAREALRNAARYGRGETSRRALHLTMTAAVQDRLLHLSIADDGVGFGGALPSAAGSGSGLTLHGTILAVMGGTLISGAAPGGGAAVTLSVPV